MGKKALTTLKSVSSPIAGSIFFVLFCFLVSCGDDKELIPDTKQDFCSSIHRKDSVNLSTVLKSIEHKLKKQTGIYVLEDGDAAMVSRAWLSEYAEKTMDIQYFIFSTDNVGLIACDYIVRAADRGVKVRILVDDILIDAGMEALMAMDSHPNIEIKIYNPGINLGKNILQKLGKLATDFRSANQRMHNKTFTVDGKVTITGGRNIADEYFDYDHEYNFRDRDVLLIGKLCKTVQESFSEFWNNELSVPVKTLAGKNFIENTSPHRFDKLHRYACNPLNFWPQVRQKITEVPVAFKNLLDSGLVVFTDSAWYVSDAPGKNDGSHGLKGGGICTDTLAALVKRSGKTIDIQSPYLVMNDESIQLMKKAVERGVKIRILTNSLLSTDNPEAFNGYQRCRRKLLEAGIKIYEMKPDAQKRFRIMTGALQEKINYTPVFGLHAKSMVVDGETTVIGTFNIDPRSMNLNTECVTVIKSRRISSNVGKEMEEEFAPENSWETTLDWNPDAKAGVKKQVKAMSRRVIPKGIL